MIFSKTFNSELYSQIVCMMHIESCFNNKFDTPVITFFFYVDGSVHTFNISFGNSDIGIKLRQEYFDGFNAADAEAIVYDKLKEGKV